MSSADSTSPEDILFLHEQLSEHLLSCLRCQANSKSKPVGLGQISQYCSEYQSIIRQWSDKEGQVNNIVNHDEYGNHGSRDFYERGGKIQ